MGLKALQDLREILVHRVERATQGCRVVPDQPEQVDNRGQQEPVAPPAGRVSQVQLVRLEILVSRVPWDPRGHRVSWEPQELLDNQELQDNQGFKVLRVVPVQQVQRASKDQLAVLV